MLLVYQIVFFQVPVISRIESIRGGRVGGGWGWRGWGAEGGVKQPLGLKEQCFALSI